MRISDWSSAWGSSDLLRDDDLDPEPDPDPDGPHHDDSRPNEDPAEPAVVDTSHAESSVVDEQGAESSVPDTSTTDGSAEHASTSADSAGQASTSAGSTGEAVQAQQPYRPKLFTVAGTGAGESGRRSRAVTTSGRRVGATKASGQGGSIHLTETIRAAAPHQFGRGRTGGPMRSEEHTSELQSLMRISYAAF